MDPWIHGSAAGAAAGAAGGGAAGAAGIAAGVAAGDGNALPAKDPDLLTECAPARVARARAPALLANGRALTRPEHWPCLSLPNA